MLAASNKEAKTRGKEGEVIPSLIGVIQKPDPPCPAACFRLDGAWGERSEQQSTTASGETPSILTLFAVMWLVAGTDLL